MSESPDCETVAFLDMFKKVKRLRLFEPSVGVLGFVLVMVSVMFCFFLLGYRSVGKGLRFSAESQRVLWVRFGGSASREKVGFLSENGSQCDVFDGDWVWDERYPLYHSRDCSFLDEGFRCAENGRPDFFYTKWRWQPKDCNLPRFFLFIYLVILLNFHCAYIHEELWRSCKVYEVFIFSQKGEIPLLHTL